MAEVQTHCLAEFSWPVGEIAWLSIASSLLDGLDALDDFDRSDQHRLASALPADDNVRTAMDSITEIDVEMSGWTEHRGIARRTAAERVARRIAFVVCLDLDDSASNRFTAEVRDEELVQQPRCNKRRRPFEVGSADNLHEWSAEARQRSNRQQFVGDH